MRTLPFLLISLAVAGLVFAAAMASDNDYVFFAGYVVLQYVVLSTAWNILGGYCGYVNFGTGAFFAIGAYSTVAIYQLIDSNEFPHVMPIPVLMLIGGIVSGIIGFGMGYLTLRLRGAFFSIATLALAVVLETLVVNWDFVGGSRGAYVLHPESVPLLGNYVRYLFLVMLLLAIAALVIARLIERSRLGYGFATIRDDELAAEAVGVPTLRLKLIATTISGALMGMAGAPFPYYIGYLQPDFDLRARLRGQLDCHAADRRHLELDRPADRRCSTRLAAADRHRNHLVGGQPSDRRLAARWLCNRGAERHRRPRAQISAAQERRLRRPPPCRARCARPRGRCRRDAGGARMSGLLEIDNLSKRFGGFVALDNISLDVAAGERLGLIGPNGSGKSTLVNCICGTLRNEQGSVRFDGRPLDGLPAHRRTHLGLARSFQLPRPFTSLSLVDNVRIPLLYTVQARGTHHAAAHVDERCHGLLREVGLEAKARHLPRDLTQVEMRKLELARAMAAEPKLLIADEAMAGLTHSEIEDILTLLVRLNEHGVTVILIEHIMRAVMSFSRRLVVLVSGRKIADGKPDEVMRDPEVERAYLGQ